MTTKASSTKLATEINSQHVIHSKYQKRARIETFLD